MRSDTVSAPVKPRLRPQMQSMPCLLDMQMGQLPQAEMLAKKDQKTIAERHTWASFATSESLNANLTVSVNPFGSDNLLNTNN